MHVLSKLFHEDFVRADVDECSSGEAGEDEGGHSVLNADKGCQDDCEGGNDVVGREEDKEETGGTAAADEANSDGHRGEDFVHRDRDKEEYCVCPIDLQNNDSARYYGNRHPKTHKKHGRRCVEAATEAEDDAGGLQERHSITPSYHR